VNITCLLGLPYNKQTYANNRTYAAEGFEEALPPRDYLFLVVVAGFASNDHQK
jgi:hypothetical protein